MTAILGYTFRNPALLTQALTHRSVPTPHHNERLEFLGDRVLNLCVAELVFTSYPEAPEGELSQRHAALVREETLAEIAKTWGLDAQLHLSAGEVRMGGRAKPSLLADAVEAVLAAVYVDSGSLAVVQTIVKTYWQPLLETVALRDAKSALQELLQAEKLPLPTYTVVAEAGGDHAKVYTVQVACAKGEAEGQGTNKQMAAQAAATVLLASLK
ncbi:MAG: ribonuclease III [Alphaproteobacteria bacterium]